MILLRSWIRSWHDLAGILARLSTWEMKRIQTHIQVLDYITDLIFGIFKFRFKYFFPIWTMFAVKGLCTNDVERSSVKRNTGVFEVNLPWPAEWIYIILTII